MLIRKKIFLAGTTLFFVYSLHLFLTFARNILIARLLGPEQFGVAATYLVVYSLVEASLEFGPDKYILQSPKGSHDEVLAAAHTITIARGFGAGIILLISGELIARAFHVPDLAWAYRALALAPVVRGFTHFDFRRQQRELSYGQEMGMNLASSVAAVIVAAIAGVMLRNHTAMLMSLLTQIGVLTVGSFVVSKAPYRFSREMADIGELLRFGWPLVFSSLIIVGALQGDRLLIGVAFGPEVLAVYSSAAIIAYAPQNILIGCLDKIMLPVLSGVRGTKQFSVRYELFGTVLAFAILTVMIPIGMLGVLFIPIVFGSGFAPDATVNAGLVAVSGISLLRSWTILAALAIGNSKLTLLSNCARLSGLLLGCAVALLGGGLATIVYSFLLGEVVALALGLVGTHRSSGLPILTGRAFLIPTLGVLFAMLPTAEIVGPMGWEAAVCATLTLQVVAALGVLVMSSHARTLFNEGLSALKLRS